MVPDNSIVIAPSLLAADSVKFGAETLKVHRSGAEWFHLDIMDGVFVPNISFGPDVIKSIRPLTNLFFDTHLMCSNPEILLEPFVRAGADSITIHVELGDKVTPLIWRIRSLGMKVGLAVNPPTSIEQVKPYLKHIDLLLVMTVNPGFGGQSFIPEMLPKIQKVHDWRKSENLGFRIQVDGGITQHTACDCHRSGADTFVSGSYLFKQPRLKTGVRKMREALNVVDQQ